MSLMKKGIREENIPIPKDGRGNSEICEEEALKSMGLIKPNIAYDMAEFTAGHIRNLLNLIYSRAALINKAAKADFYVPEELIIQINNTTAFDAITDYVWCIRNREVQIGEKIRGLELTEENLMITGFPATDDRELIHAYIQLTAAMIGQCMKQRGVLPRVVIPREGNEKYIFRSWINRIGMIGPEYRETRKYLLYYLEGDAACCRWKTSKKNR